MTTTTTTKTTVTTAKPLLLGRVQLLDWTTGLTQTAQCTLLTEAKHIYSLIYFATVTLVTFLEFLEVKSRVHICNELQPLAYMIQECSFNKAQTE